MNEQVLAEILASLDAALAKRAGSFLNPKSVRVKDLEAEYKEESVGYAGGSYVKRLIVFKHKATSKSLPSDLQLLLRDMSNGWWIVLGELNQLA